MGNIFKTLLVASALLFSSLSSATIISVTYDVDFTSHSNNATDRAWVNGVPTDYDTNNEVNNYLDGSSYYLTVEYDTGLLGYSIDKRDNSVNPNVNGEFRATITGSNIDLTLSDYIHEHYQARTDSTYTSTQVDNFLSFDFLGSLEDLKVGDISAYGDMYNASAGWYDYIYAPGTSQEKTLGEQSIDIYLADLTVRNIELASVPEPSIIALFGLGLVGLGFARRRRS